MDCRDIEQLLDVYLDRELNDEAVQQFEEHLDACRECHSRHGAFLDLLTSEFETAVPPGLRERILQATAEVPLPSMPPKSAPVIYSYRPLWIGAAAACLTLFVTSWMVLHLKPDADHGGVGPVATNVQQIQPSPGLVASCAQAAVLRGRVGPLAVLAQAAAIDGLLQAPQRAATTVMRRRAQDQPPPEQSGAVPQMSVLLSLSTLGV